jgi:hypothetical protein
MLCDHPDVWVPMLCDHPDIRAIQVRGLVRPVMPLAMGLATSIVWGKLYPSTECNNPIRIATSLVMGNR